MKHLKGYKRINYNQCEIQMTNNGVHRYMQEQHP